MEKGMYMGIVHMHYGQPSYSVESSIVRAAVTVRGGHLIASFDTGMGEVDPFYIAPWWHETLAHDIPGVLQVLRGDFFCFPFGGGEDRKRNITYPPHGHTACNPWDFGGLHERGGARTLELHMDLAAGGRITKRITLREDEPVIYIDHSIEGFVGEMPLGNHPTLKLPDEVGAGIVDLSPPLFGLTAPEPFEQPRTGGYSRLQPNVEITDRSAVPTIEGTTMDLTRYPTSPGYEDLALFVSDPERDFCFTSVSVPIGGYLYFQLKNPRVFGQTLFWMSNGGRHYAPWNGRVRSVLGVEEITSNFHYGLQRSVKKNLLMERGCPTFVPLDGGKASFRLIMGIVAVDQGFIGVKEIVKRDEHTVTVLGRGGEGFDVPCRVDFLR
jgi:hypothetical protein